MALVEFGLSLCPSQFSYKPKCPQNLCIAFLFAFADNFLQRIANLLYRRVISNERNVIKLGINQPKGVAAN